MNVRRLLGLVVLSVWGTTACAVGVDDSTSVVFVPDGGQERRDSALGDDVAADSREVEDTGVADGGVDSTVVADSAAVDTAVGDTMLADTGGVTDTAVTDTAVTDTAVTDTAVTDTAVTDTASGADSAGDAATCAIRGCVTGTESRKGCANARTIGRATAATSTGYKISDNLCSATDNFDESGTSCWDANADHAYKIWLQAGDTLGLSLTTSWPCAFDLFTWYASLKIIENSGCDSTACTTRTYCSSNKTSHSKTDFVAPRDGWYIVVVEGASAFDDEGDYTFTAKLTCKTPGCGC